MNISTNRTSRDIDHSRAAQGHVFTNRRNRIVDCIRHSATSRISSSLHSFHIGIARTDNNAGDVLGERLEVAVARNEVGFRIHFNDNTACALDGQRDEAFSGDAIRLFGSLRKALLTQPVDRSFNVAVGFIESRFAIHHARASLFAQVLHQSSGDIGHEFHPLLRSQASGPQPERVQTGIYDEMTTAGPMPAAISCCSAD